MVAVKQFKTDQGQVFASIFSEAEQSLLLNVFSGNKADEQEISSVIKYSLQHLKSQKLDYWLSDFSELQDKNGPGIKSMLKRLVEMLKRSHLKKFSLVSNRSLTERRKLERYIAKSGVEFKTFANLAKASEWLLVPELDAAVWDNSPELNF
ncbi:hypothetical protein A9R00_00375 [Oleispira antarctica]|uniref:STAS/SEC14 domain-containing protein n=1 Tax=Oleispira antarctica TaxID=188908 RepID=A0A1Y5HW76_OLEAN|nr:hypothetical protein A9R00_00375 [Oleispira antarctica]